MSVVRINVLEVPEGRGEVLEQRFAARAGEVETVDGFESFELLRPTDGTDRYLVVTRWRDEDAFQAWLSSNAFQRGHAQQAAAQSQDGPAAGAPSGSQGEGGAPSGQAAGSASGQAAGSPSGQAAGSPSGPAASGSELWSFDVVTSATSTRA